MPVRKEMTEKYQNSVLCRYNGLWPTLCPTTEMIREMSQHPMFLLREAGNGSCISHSTVTQRWEERGVPQPVSEISVSTETGSTCLLGIRMEVSLEKLFKLYLLSKLS